MRARVVRRAPLRYRAPLPGLPPHVRGASALAWLGGHLVVVQDDALALGVVDVDAGTVDAVVLPAGPDGAHTFDAARGNKAAKPDLEAALVVGGVLFALGSGGPLPARQRLARWQPPAGPTWIDGAATYATLAAALVPGGGALNLEGAAAHDDLVWLAGRGGDAFAGGVTTDELIAVPIGPWLEAGAALPPTRVRRTLVLGQLDGAALHVTELATSPRGLAYLAAAERTTSFYDDGVIVGSALGWVDGEAPAAVLDEAGGLLVAKLEGLAFDPTDPTRAWAVDDADAPDRPATLFELRLA